MRKRPQRDPLEHWLHRRRRGKWFGLWIVFLCFVGLFIWIQAGNEVSRHDGVAHRNTVDTDIDRISAPTLKSPRVSLNEIEGDCDGVCTAMEYLDAARRGGWECPDGSVFPPDEPLDWDDALADVAKLQAEFLVDAGYLSHETPESRLGTRVVDRVRDVVDLDRSGEVLYRGSTKGRLAMSWWLQSTEHCRLLMRPDMNAMGLHTVQGEQGAVWVGLVGRYRD